MVKFGMGKDRRAARIRRRHDPEFTGVENIYMNASCWDCPAAETDRLFPKLSASPKSGISSISPSRRIRVACTCGWPLRLPPALSLIFDHRRSPRGGRRRFSASLSRPYQELHERGTTVLFVSHDAAAVRALCSRAILMKSGQIVIDGKRGCAQSISENHHGAEKAYRSELRKLSKHRPRICRWPRFVTLPAWRRRRKLSAPN